MDNAVLAGQVQTAAFKKIERAMNTGKLNKKCFENSHVLKKEEQNEEGFFGYNKPQNIAQSLVNKQKHTNIVGALVKTRRTPERDYRPYETAYDRRKSMYGIVEWQSEKGFACVRILSNRGKFIYKECFCLNELEIIMYKENLMSFLNM